MAEAARCHPFAAAAVPAVGEASTVNRIANINTPGPLPHELAQTNAQAGAATADASWAAGQPS